MYDTSINYTGIPLSFYIRYDVKKYISCHLLSPSVKLYTHFVTEIDKIKYLYHAARIHKLSYDTQLKSPVKY